MNLAFEKNKLQRNLDRSGKDYDFCRTPKNAFGEPVRCPHPNPLPLGEGTAFAKKIGTIRGLYHEVSNYVALRMTDTTQERKHIGQGAKKDTRILCLMESVKGIDLKFGDFTTINGKRFNVVAVTNVQEWNIIADISLEVVDDGNQVSL